MHLITKPNVLDDAAQHPDASEPVKRWCAAVRQADWQNIEEVRQVYREAEAVGNFTVFNIKGNDYRLIVGIDYEDGTVYYKYFLTHAEYDKGKWKNDSHF